jgi:hypothetical protein
VNFKNIYLYEEIVNQKGIFTIWKNSTFWLKWFEQETKDNKLQQLTDKEEISMTILKSITDTMFKLKIENRFILTTVIDELGVQFVKEVYLY